MISVVRRRHQHNAVYLHFSRCPNFLPLFLFIYFIFSLFIHLVSSVAAFLLLHLRVLTSFSLFFFPFDARYPIITVAFFFFFFSLPTLLPPSSEKHSFFCLLNHNHAGTNTKTVRTRSSTLFAAVCPLNTRERKKKTIVISRSTKTCNKLYTSGIAKLPFFFWKANSVRN